MVSKGSVAAVVSDGHNPSRHALHPVQAPDTFKLVLDTNVSSVLCVLHLAVGRKTPGDKSVKLLQEQGGLTGN